MTSSLTRIYLDNAATSFPKPEEVCAAITDYLTHNGAAFGRGSYAASEEASRIVAQCRQRTARLLTATSSTEIAFTFNCTDSLNLLLRGLLKPNDRVVTTALEHNSVLRPLQQLQSENGVCVESADFDTQSGLVDLEQLRSLINAQKTRLVVLNHASNVTGTIQPAKEVARMAHEAGALVLLDAAQTAGHLPFDVVDLNIDFLATAGHKGLLGPLGTGVIYVKNGLEGQLRPVRSGGTGTQSESIKQPTAMPDLFESGNLNMPGLTGLNAAVEWLSKQDRDELHSRISGQTTSLNDGLRLLEGVTVHSPAETPNAGIVSFAIDGVDSREAATILDQSFGVQCRAGFHCAPLVHKAYGTAESGGSLRLSPGPFTKDSDIETAIEAVQQLSSSMRLL